jgi:PqqD family protein of HPr-rel-A system
MLPLDATGYVTYGINTICRLHWRSWEDLHCVFDEVSGQTHQLDPLRALILNALCVEELRFDEILNELANVPSFAQEEHVADVLQVVLSEFSSIGLVEVIKH